MPHLEENYGSFTAQSGEYLWVKCFQKPHFFSAFNTLIEAPNSDWTQETKITWEPHSNRWSQGPWKIILKSHKPAYANSYKHTHIQFNKQLECTTVHI